METALINKINFKNVMKFTIPTIIMMVFMAVYQMVDGIFISNIIGTNALSAVNIVYPVISILIGISIMLGTGGCAIIATNLGEGRHTLAKQRFTFIIITGAVIGVVIFICAFCCNADAFHLFFPCSWKAQARFGCCCRWRHRKCNS